MKKRILVIAAMVAMVVVGCFYASAIPMPKADGPMDGEGGPGGPNLEMPGSGPEKHLELLVVALDLNDAQKEQIQQILDAGRSRHEELRQELRQDEQALRQMLDASSFDEASFRAMSLKAAEKRIDLMVAGARLKPQVLAALTAEQQAKAEKIFQLLGPPPHGKGKPF